MNWGLYSGISYWQMDGPPVMAFSAAQDSARRAEPTSQANALRALGQRQTIPRLFANGMNSPPLLKKDYLNKMVWNWPKLHKSEDIPQLKMKVKYVSRPHVGLL